MIFGLQFWQALAAVAAGLSVCGYLSNSKAALNIGAVVFVALIAMRLKKVLISGLEGHSVAMLIWSLAGSYLIYTALKYRENYGIPLIQPLAGIVLIFSGGCYLWARIENAHSVIGAPHAATADYLVLAALVLGGVHFCGVVIANGFRGWDMVDSHINRD